MPFQSKGFELIYNFPTYNSTILIFDCRDSSELQKPQNVNAAVLKFYKYVKAARDGQDQKDCIAANPKCII